MAKEFENYDNAVKVIKTAILESQYEACKSINEKQLVLYFKIGKYISINSRNGAWGDNALQIISERLDREVPGLRGFSKRSLFYMRNFYEEWSFIDNPEAKKQILHPWVHNLDKFNIEFISIGFTHHRTILEKVKAIEERVFYIELSAVNHLVRRDLEALINEDYYHKRGQLPNNFSTTIAKQSNAFKAISSFKDEYLLDYINVEEIDVRDKQDIDERVLEQQIVHNIKKFILTFGKDFAFIGNQYHLQAFGEDQYIDLLFFNRDLNCLVAIELKTGEFKTSYLGQLSGYLSILDKFEKKEHENPSIGIVLCKNMNKSFVDFVMRDYSKPMGVATYKTSKDMPERLLKALPDIKRLEKMLNEKDE